MGKARKGRQGAPDPVSGALPAEQRQGDVAALDEPERLAERPRVRAGGHVLTERGWRIDKGA